MIVLRIIIVNIINQSDFIWVCNTTVIRVKQNVGEDTWHWSHYGFIMSARHKWLFWRDHNRLPCAMQLTMAVHVLVHHAMCNYKEISEIVDCIKCVKCVTVTVACIDSRDSEPVTPQKLSELSRRSLTYGRWNELLPSRSWFHHRRIRYFFPNSRSFTYTL